MDSKLKMWSDFRIVFTLKGKIGSLQFRESAQHVFVGNQSTPNYSKDQFKIVFFEVLCSGTAHFTIIKF
jgi:hypothetical protein